MNRLASRVSLSALCIGMAAGCVDARDEFDQYGHRVVDADNRVIDGMIVSSLPNIAGDWLFSVRPDLAKKRVFKMRVELGFTAVTENTGELDFSGQPLDFETDEPVGTFLFVSNDVVINNDGTFVAPLEGTLHGRANPVVPGSAAAIDALLHGSIISEDYICGELTGTAGSLDLQGSTLGMVRVIDGVLPPPLLRCSDVPTQ